MPSAESPPTPQANPLAGMAAYLRKSPPSQPSGEPLQMIRSLLFLVLLGLPACSGGLDVGSLVRPADAERRGAVEVAVKSAYPGILNEIEAGAGPNLQAALDAAGVPPGDRPARLIQLRGDLALYEANPGALVAALLLYGG